MGIFRSAGHAPWAGLLGLMLWLVPASGWSYQACRSDNECFFESMPLISQNNPDIGSTWLPNGPEGSMLCGPTSAVMTLSALLAEGLPEVNSGTPIVNMISGKTHPERIRQLAAFTGTSPTGGLSFWGVKANTGEPIGLKLGMSDRKSDFKTGKAGGVTAACQPGFDAARVKALLQGRRVTLPGACMPTVAAQQGVPAGSLSGGGFSSGELELQPEVSQNWSSTDDASITYSPANTTYADVLQFWGGSSGFKTGIVLGIGTYKTKYLAVNGKTYISFERLRGHYVSVRGHFYHFLEIFDPWYAQRSFRTLRKLEGGWRSSSVHVELPGGVPWISVLKYEMDSAVAHPGYPPPGTTLAQPAAMGIPASGSQHVMVDGISLLWLD